MAKQKKATLRLPNSFPAWFCFFSGGALIFLVVLKTAPLGWLLLGVPAFLKSFVGKKKPKQIKKLLTIQKFGPPTN